VIPFYKLPACLTTYLLPTYLLPTTYLPTHPASANAPKQDWIHWDKDCSVWVSTGPYSESPSLPQRRYNHCPLFLAILLTWNPEAGSIKMSYTYFPDYTASYSRRPWSYKESVEWMVVSLPYNGRNTELDQKICYWQIVTEKAGCGREIMVHPKQRLPEVEYSLAPTGLIFCLVDTRNLRPRVFLESGCSDRTVISFFIKTFNMQKGIHFVVPFITLFHHLPHCLRWTALPFF
jgi:hypothetical protein